MRKWKPGLGVVAACAALASLAAGAAQASLKKFELRVLNITNTDNVSPNPDVAHPKVLAIFHRALIDDAAGPGPILRRFVRAQDSTHTTHVPALALDIFVSFNFREGPDVVDQIHGNPVASFTGTGNISAASSIRWGIVTGWTITGSFWCNANPSLVCDLALGQDDATVEMRFNSEFYDLGTWSFHGTGFTSVPFISSNFTAGPGNTEMWVSGFPAQDGTVPALPLLAVSLLGGSLLAGGSVALRRRGQRGQARSD